MAYTPDPLVIDTWTSPIVIGENDYIANLDDQVNEIVSDDANSMVNHVNTELAKLPNYLSTELTEIEAEAVLAVTLEKYNTEAWKKTAESYATEAYNTEVNLYTSDGDGTYTATPQTGVYSALHYATVANNVVADKIEADDYATSTVGGTVKARLAGTVLYLTLDGTDA